MKIEKERTINLKNLEILRKSHSLSVAKLMEILGHNRLTYYAWQKSGAMPSGDVIKLHKLFNVSTDLLLDVKPIAFETPHIDKTAISSNPDQNTVS